MDKKSQKLADKIQKYLEEHNDDEDHIRYLGSEKFTITAAVGILLDGTKCGWFLDVIYGIHSIKKFKKFKGPETWTFTKDGRGGIITGIDSRNKVICEQRVVGVDFPFDSTKLLVDYMDFDETYVLFEEEYRG